MVTSPSRVETVTEVSVMLEIVPRTGALELAAVDDCAVDAVAPVESVVVAAELSFFEHARMPRVEKKRTALSGVRIELCLEQKGDKRRCMGWTMIADQRLWVADRGLRTNGIDNRGLIEERGLKVLGVRKQMVGPRLEWFRRWADGSASFRSCRTLGRRWRMRMRTIRSFG